MSRANSGFGPDESITDPTVDDAEKIDQLTIAISDSGIREPRLVSGDVR